MESKNKRPTLNSLKSRISELEKERGQMVNPDELISWLSSIHPANLAFPEDTQERRVAEAISAKMYSNIHAMRAAFKKLVVLDPDSKEAEDLFEALKSSIHIGGIQDGSTRNASTIHSSKKP